MFVNLDTYELAAKIKMKDDNFKPYWIMVLKIEISRSLQMVRSIEPVMRLGWFLDSAVEKSVYECAKAKNPGMEVEL
ncbi:MULTISPECIES: hypothetical protein [Peribacillus]|uniref:Uncharacterized protein n=1 Tax=Peribacillus simplex TaxID=1478 RepID=A0A9W4L5K7_9BACI|nr:hypothetical protein [Peribacillus simplex]MDR4926925.1 hypothetical protein [Peribacillus simplex]CAH0264047.1 hypothetical protein SRABI133_03471 [Peribacillus simplex]